MALWATATRAPGAPLAVAGPGGWPGPGKLPSGNPGGTCMANRPVNTGSGGAAAPAAPAGHRATRTGRTARSAPAARAPRASRVDGDPGTSALGWLPYLIVLAGVAAGMFVAWKGSKYAGRGAGL